jgi:hypothetical protein
MKTCRNRKVATVLVLLTAAAVGQGASISGRVVGDDGTAVGGATVTALRVAPSPFLRLRAVSQADGAYRFVEVEPGRYRFCVQEPSGQYLDPCAWEPPRPEVTLGSAQEARVLDQKVQRGWALAVRVSDAQGLLDKEVPSTRSRPQVLMGVFTPLGLFVPAALTGRDALGRDHRVTIPFDVRLNFSVTSGQLELVGEDQRALPATGAVIAVEHRAGDGNSKPVTLIVRGLRPWPEGGKSRGPKASGAKNDAVETGGG